MKTTLWFVMLSIAVFCLFANQITLGEYFITIVLLLILLQVNQE